MLSPLKSQGASFGTNIQSTQSVYWTIWTHPDVAIKLFSDSTQAVKSEGCFKLAAKSNKGAAYLQLANGIFSIDDDLAVQADFITNPNKYAKAVNNYITNKYVLS